MSRFDYNKSRALAGALGALRWAITQRSDDACADHVLIKMGARANSSFECYMSVGNLAAEVGCSVRTVQRKIRHLLARGYLVDISHHYPWRQTNTYRLCPSPEEID